MNNSKVAEKALSPFKNSKGKVVVWQKPNIPLSGWLLFKLLSIVTNEAALKNSFGMLSKAFLFTWAYLEVTSGESYFRRVLGSVIMIMLVVGYFK